MEIQSILKPLIPSVSSTQLPLEWNILKLPSYYRQQANGEMYVRGETPMNIQYRSDYLGNIIQELVRIFDW